MVCLCAILEVYFLAAFVVTDSDTCCSVWMTLPVFPWLLELSVVSDLHKQKQILLTLVVPTTETYATHYSIKQTRFWKLKLLWKLTESFIWFISPSSSMDVDGESKKLLGLGQKHLVMGNIPAAVNAFQEAASLLWVVECSLCFCWAWASAWLFWCGLCKKNWDFYLTCL